MTAQTSLKLPPELLLAVVEALVPSNPHFAYPPAHPSTRTLLSFTLVSTLTHNVARNLLFAHCLYLDSEERMKKLIKQADGNNATGRTKDSKNKDAPLYSPQKLRTARFNGLCLKASKFFAGP
ncbi:uncharacterized protein BDV14DRAFT_201210 [Aspergillus stella-maris]|uniref:uncharacterized protein n=1 Tax=Aspergillus stella-maris TaxID=1810926 RepID=UPI003CCD6839